jgi:hypothetical protein
MRCCTGILIIPLTVTVASNNNNFIFDETRNCGHGIPDRCNFGVHYTIMFNDDPTVHYDWSLPSLTILTFLPPTFPFN